MPASFFAIRRAFYAPAFLMVFACLAVAGDEADKKFPLHDQLKVLEGNVQSKAYRELVLKKMLSTDLAAEWQRVATVDSSEAFLKKHGGKDAVLADATLKRAYERRQKIENDFLDLMREGFKKYKQPAPFDKGAKAEPAGTELRKSDAKAAELSVVMPSPGAEKNWPRFRGPTGQGVTDAVGLPTTWDKGGANILWRVKTPGVGNSSPIVWGDRIFLTSSDVKGTARYVHCFDVKTGANRWTQQVASKPPEPSVRDKNGYASATPVTDGERVISVLGSCGIVCYDLDGKHLWTYDDFKIKTTHGVGSCPVLYKHLVIFSQDQNQADSIFLALDKRTGKRVWQSKRAKAMSWTTPTIAHVGDHDEILIAGAQTIRGYDPMSGKELWSMQGPTVEVIPMIIVGKDLLFSASGRNGPTIAFRAGGSGDVSKTHLVWRTVRGGPHVPSPGLVKGRLYTANDNGIVMCLDAQTGKIVYQDRIDDRFSASPLIAGDLLYFCSESGVTYVVRAGDRFDLVSSNDLGSPILASPAVTDGKIILRTADELVCIGAKR